jgi:potassium/hydrogen antiporter
LAYLFNDISGCGYKLALLNAIPLAVISSAIAIPSARNLSPVNREFITYESSLSDIFGVLLFNFVNINDGLSLHALLNFSGELGLMLFISLISILVLSLLLNNISHHVKFFSNHLAYCSDLCHCQTVSPSGSGVYFIVWLISCQFRKVKNYPLV